MKKLFIICFLMYTGMNLFAQNYDYGLSQDDLNLLLGYYVPNKEKLKRLGLEESFSWGKQTVIRTDGDFVLIDYNIYINLRMNKKYEKYLLIKDTGNAFLIKDIEKLSANKFKLSIFSSQKQTYEDLGSKDEGYMIITFLDNVHIVLEKTNSIMGFFSYKDELLKTAGPVGTFE